VLVTARRDRDGDPDLDLDLDLDRDRDPDPDPDRDRDRDGDGECAHCSSACMQRRRSVRPRDGCHGISHAERGER
jgi:hypothetical protein